MSDNTDPDDIYSPRGSCPPPTEPSSSQKFSDLHGAKDTAIDQTPDVETSNPENEPEPLSSESPPDPSISESSPDPSSESPPEPSSLESPLDASSSESPPEPLNVEDLPGATTAPEHPTPKDGSVPSHDGLNDPARTNDESSDVDDESSDVDDEIEIDRALVLRPQGRGPHSGPLESNALINAAHAFMSRPRPQTNGTTTINNFFINEGNFSFHHTTGPDQPAGDPPQPAANPPQPQVDPPADEATSPKASSASTSSASTSSASTSSNEQETKPAAGSDKGEKVQSFVRDATLPFRWMCGILLRKHVLKFIAILFGLFVLVPIVITLGVYGLSHAPSYVSNQILGKDYEFGNPFGALYPTWMPSWGSSQDDTVPKMRVTEEAQEPSPLTFRRPIPQVETDILPDVILRYEKRLAGTNHENKVALLDDLAKSKKRAQDQKKFNQNFIDDMEAWSNLQYRHLQALVSRVDLILKELSGEVAGGTAAQGGNEWRWWESRATARQKTLQRNLDWFNRIIDNINEGVSTGNEEIVGIVTQYEHGSDPGNQAPGLRRAKHTLRHSEDAEIRDLASGFNIICSSEKRTGERWRHVREAIKKFQRLQKRARQMFNNRSNHYGDLEHAYRDIKALAMELMDALKQFARLSEEDEG
ncbi:hypothetical protein CEP51_001941 [Fusarium floridanum]|uniref:Uncharacterized protein n=1 Tax=Fusarium floridanum TaxID=1325733 RepID=A0A428SE30_9HYPO|nr:hypothetical protein CEP51_001941 [Fusarium floridanum]